MAKYEDRGYCPANALQKRAWKLEKPLIAESIRELGSRIEFMVYPYGYIPEGEPLVFQLMDTPTIGKVVTSVLNALIPICIYPEVGRMIELRDVDSSSLKTEEDVLLTGDRFKVGIEVHDDVIVMKIAKA